METIGPNPDDANLIEAYTSVYEAGVHPELWSDSLSRIQQLFDNAPAAISTYDFKSNRGRIWLETGFDKRHIQTYRKKYAAMNPWLLREELLRSAGTVCTGEELSGQDELIRSRFYNEWLKPQKLRYSLHGVLFRQNREICLYSMLRGSEAGEFNRSEITKFRLILPHLQRAVEINRTVSDLEMARGNAEDALDRLAIGVILLDDHGKVLEANRRARQLCKQGDGLAIQNNKLQPSSSRDASDLHRMINFALRSAQAGWDESNEVLPISRPSGRRPFTLLVSSLGTSSIFLNEKRSTAAVFLVDPEQHEPLDQGSLRQLYGLTRSESRLAAKLASGQRLEEISEELGVRPSTSRSHLRSIFSKTGCERQSDLMRLLLMNPAQFVSLNGSAFAEPSPDYSQRGVKEVVSVD